MKQLFIENDLYIDHKLNLNKNILYYLTYIKMYALQLFIICKIKSLIILMKKTKYGILI